MDAIRKGNSLLEDLVSVTVQLIDAARSGNPHLLEELGNRRDVLVERMSRFFKQGPSIDSKSLGRWHDLLTMVQKLDAEMISLLARHRNIVARELKSLEVLKKDLLKESASEGRGQRVQTQG